MTDRDRLIELNRNAKLYAQEKADERGGLVCIDDEVDYLLANGVIVPPCKVGDKVYTYGAKRIKEWEITFVGKNSRNEYKFIAVVGKCEDLLIFWNYEIGKTVFLTKEEAEKALAERSEGNG